MLRTGTCKEYEDQKTSDTYYVNQTIATCREICERTDNCSSFLLGKDNGFCGLMKFGAPVVCTEYRDNDYYRKNFAIHADIACFTCKLMIILTGVGYFGNFTGRQTCAITSSIL